MAVTSFLDTVFRRRKKEPPTDFINIFEFDFDTIKAATEVFSDLIGRGGFGSVYKGRLQSGQLIAVKVMSENPNRTHKEFQTELNLLSKLRHKNLIHLLGFSSKRDQHCLVFEFMPNSSLDCFLFDPHRASQLNWEVCRNIIQGIARGIRYLHEESGLCVVHRDIKPANILLDSDFKPKISGFECSRLIKDGDYESETTRVIGTLGYLDPAYYLTGRLSVKSDVYAFGVTILTIISRRKPILRYGEENLIEYVKRCLDRGEAIDVIHEVLREDEEDSISEILRYIHIALQCIDENAETRPNIDKVLHWFSCLTCLSTPSPEPIISDRSLGDAETNLSLSPSLSPGHNSDMSPISPRYGDRSLANAEINMSLSPSLSPGHNSDMSSMSPPWEIVCSSSP